MDSFCPPSDDSCNTLVCLLNNEDTNQPAHVPEFSRLLINLSELDGKEESSVGPYDVNLSLAEDDLKSKCSCDNPEDSSSIVKRKGGWPKGKKRKLVIDNLKTPRAPTTGYILFSNERRQQYKISNPDLAFTEVTKLLGSEWLNLHSREKQKYLDRAEEDKTRYLKELQAYRKSEFGSEHGTECEKSNSGEFSLNDTERTMQVPPDRAKISNELYCDVCNQFFTSLHNKKEHLYGKQHLQTVTFASAKYRKDSPLPSSHHLRLNGVSRFPLLGAHRENFATDVNQSIHDFIEMAIGRQNEIKELNLQLGKTRLRNINLLLELGQVQSLHSQLQGGLTKLKADESAMTEQLHNLRMVPALFGVIHFQR